MKRMTGIHNHQCCPREFKGTPDFTGNFELDAVISRNPNKNMRDRLQFYSNGVPFATTRSEGSYGPRTAYNGYDGYDGDE